MQMTLTEGTSEEAGHPEKCHQWPCKVRRGDPEARRLPPDNFRKANVSGHHPPSDKKRHTPSFYFINYPKPKQQDALLALKPAWNYADLLQTCSVAELPKHPWEASPTFLKNSVCISIYIMVDTVTHHLGLGEEDGHDHGALQPKPLADPTPPPPGGRRAGPALATFQPPLLQSKTLLKHVQVWLIPIETAGRELRN